MCINSLDLQQRRCHDAPGTCFCSTNRRLSVLSRRSVDRAVARDSRRRSWIVAINGVEYRTRMELETVSLKKKLADVYDFDIWHTYKRSFRAAPAKKTARGWEGKTLSILRYIETSIFRYIDISKFSVRYPTQIVALGSYRSSPEMY